jgi:hypothetical protein
MTPLDRTSILEKEIIEAACDLVDAGSLNLGALVRLDNAVREYREGKTARRNRIRRRRYAEHVAIQKEAV